MAEINQAFAACHRKSTTFHAAGLDRDIPVRIFKGAGGAEADAPVVLYVLNHGAPRIGQEDDLSILRDLLAEGYIVLTADFGGDPRAVSPDVDGDLHGLFQAVYGLREGEGGGPALLDGTGLTPRRFRCFTLPAGYRIATDLVYWEIDRHAVHGTLSYVMASYNESVAGKVPGKSAVTSPAEMTDRQGRPLDYKVRMDIVYPSRASRKVPLVYNLATQPQRQACGSPGDYRPHLTGFLMRGYAIALIGHCYNPVVPAYEHILRFTLDHWNGLACYTAALRFIRANAGRYAIDEDAIGGMGHSKGQYSVTRLSDPHCAATSEQYAFPGFPPGSPEPQPLPGYASHISAGYQSMGMGLFRPQYVTKDYAPTIVACGEKENLMVSLVGHANFVKRLEEMDIRHVAMTMKGLGHELAYGWDEDLGVDRYRLVAAFFDRTLKPAAGLPPAVLLLSPRDGATNASPWAPVAVHFAPGMDARSVSSGVRLLRDGHPVGGSWKASHGGTRFTFTPEADLAEGVDYRLVVSRDVKDVHGTRLGRERTATFRLGPRAWYAGR